ncbi:LysR family transcriptional regulator [Microbacterium karelineae]|uniref:LysR family transcriptional regulator n=1 Tax=Microbacterium karelineae TaxID=2654283 RepID=UPI0012E9BE99|nr:LysR family transcriptional regulator [Microbacterium karelineae]
MTHGAMDLNLVRVFVAVHEARSLTVAASRLFVTQSAVSQSLARLRREFDDPLFRRQGRAMDPTPLADSLYPGFRDALAAVDRTLDQVHAFDPSTSDRTFRIAMSELGEIGWGATLLGVVTRQAPRMPIEIVPIDVDALPSWLARGVVDLAVTPRRLAGVARGTVLKTQRYGVVMSRENPLAAGEVDLESFLAAQHVDVAEDSGARDVRAALDRVGGRRDPHILVNHYASLPPLIARSRELVAVVPDTIAAGWAREWPLVVRSLPFDMPPVEVRLYRRATTQHAAALDWLYDTVARAIRGSSGQFFVIHGDRGAQRP